MAENSWIVEPALVDDVFSDDPEGLWSTVLRRKGQQWRLVATMPQDPSRN
jgi:putative transcriptional regulator